VGMHFGVIAARVTPETLLGALAPRIPSYEVVGDVVAVADLPERVGDEAPLASGSLDDAAFLLDPAQLVSTDPDVLVEASRIVGGLVASIGAETTSGTYWLIVAEDGALRRLHWNSLWGLPQPYDTGTSLPAEADRPLEDVDGVGLTHVLRSLGFRLDGWLAAGPFSVIRPEYGTTDPGPHQQALTSYFETHSTFDPNRLPTPIVVDRGSGRFDLAAAGSRLPDGTMVGEAVPAKRGLLGRLLRR